MVLCCTGFAQLQPDNNRKQDKMLLSTRIVFQISGRRVLDRDWRVVNVHEKESNSGRR